MSAKFENLRRERHPMPPFVKKALIEHDLMAQYKARPAYQQNDYFGWINRAKKEVTKDKRLEQMLVELRKGGVYMNMAHQASAKTKER
ncbi:MAG: hypothetical protein EX270_04900 [Pseudomonadales bacterium]|nr:MAG: hypothetical protein EX270_04900 [Pseudomonadales bacterium]